MLITIQQPANERISKTNGCDGDDEVHDNYSYYDNPSNADVTEIVITTYLHG